MEKEKNKEELIYLNALNIVSYPLDYLKIKNILKYFGSIKNFWEKANINEIENFFSKQITQKLIEIRNKLDIYQEFEKLNKEKIKLISVFDKDYPPLLKEISYPPILLYIKGNLFHPDENLKNKEFCLAVVGSRKATNYGWEVCKYFIEEFSKHPICIVSGLAFGIDSIAHKTSLLNKIRTIAVLGSSVDEKNIYPRSNLSLAKEILKNDGAIISEYPINTKPQKYLFPLRNRIISGLSKGVLVIEAAAKSGALITANIATEQNREVFAVPGSIFSQNSEGTNNLIKSGAKLVSKPIDVLEEFGIIQELEKVEYHKDSLKLTKEEKIIVDILSNEPIQINEIIQKSSFDASKINSLLLLLELKGIIKNLGEGYYSKNF